MSNLRRSRWQEKEELDLCYHCKKPGHLIAECHPFKATSSKRVPKKKAMKATWDNSESDSEEEVDAVNVCFMTYGDDTTKVYLENSLDDDELTMDEFATF